MFRKIISLSQRVFNLPQKYKIAGASTLAFGTGMAIGSHMQTSNPDKMYRSIHQANIRKALQITPTATQAILAQEAKEHEKVREDLKHMKLLLTKDEVAHAVSQIAKQIAKQFKDEPHLLVLTMLQGANYFSTDLKRELSDEGLLFQEDVVRISRYGNSHQGSQPKIERLPEAHKITGRKILIIEDLIEEGVTLDATIKALVALGANPSDIYIAAFTNKENARKPGFEHIQPHFSGFNMKENKWIVGFGCDQKGYVRAQRDLLYLPEEAQKILGYRP